MFLKFRWIVFKEEADVKIDEPAHRPPHKPEEVALDAAAEMIQAARKPVLIAGGGTQDASDDVVRLAERNSACRWLLLPMDRGLFRRIILCLCAVRR